MSQEDMKQSSEIEPTTSEATGAAAEQTPNGQAKAVSEKKVEDTYKRLR